MHRETRAGTPEANAAFARGNCLKGILDDDVDVLGPIHSSTESAAEDSAGEESGGPTTRQKIVKTANRKHFRNDSAAESVPVK